MPACAHCGEPMTAGAAACPSCGMAAQPKGGGSRASKPSGGMSGATIVLIVVGCLGGVFLLLCAGGMIFGVANARNAARIHQSRNNLKMIGLALHNYHDTSQAVTLGGSFDEAGRGHHGWQTRLLPYIEGAHIYNQVRFDVPWDDPSNAGPMSTVFPPFLSPLIAGQNADARGHGLSHYAGNSHVLLKNQSLKFREISDGLSNTVFAGEAAGNFKAWGDPVSVRDPALGINKGPDTFGRPDGKGAAFLMMDGSAREVSSTVDPAVLKAISTPAGGEPVPEF